MSTIEALDTCHCCHSPIDSNFCSQCGQKRYKRIDKSYISDELQYTFLHANKGLFYTLKNLIKNPGKTAKEYIDGNRVHHYKPILLVSVLSGISTFISAKILKFSEIMAKILKSTKQNSPMMQDSMEFLAANNSLILYCAVPLFAICTWLAFRKWGHNYYEHIIINSYILSIYMVVNILLIYPLYYFLKDSQASTIGRISIFAYTLIIPLLIWFFRHFYSQYKFSLVVKRVALCLLWVILGYIGLIIVFGIGLGIYISRTGPESLKYIQPGS